MSNVQNLLSQHLPTALFTRLEGATPSLSKKSWVENYAPVRPTFQRPTYASIHERFAGEKENWQDNIYTPDASEQKRLDTAVYPLNNTGTRVIQTEGDVARDFYTHTAQAINLAWDPNYNKFERSESGPPGPTNVSETVDYSINWKVNGKLEACIVVGEFKKWGIIVPDQWQNTSGRGSDAFSSTSTRLGQEMRG